MKSWLLFSLTAMILWGIWGFFGKLASRSVGYQNIVLLSALGNMLVFPALFLAFLNQFNFQWNSPNHYFAVLGGMTGSIGVLFFYLALSKIDASRVVVITAMYPLVTVLLSFTFLHEHISVQKMVGILLAIASIILLSS